MEGKGAHYMGYRLLSGIKNDFVLKFSLTTYTSMFAIRKTCHVNCGIVHFGPESGKDTSHCWARFGSSVLYTKSPPNN